MLFADGFWKEPNVYDVVGIVGLVIGIGSVWFAWLLAKQDIKQRIEQATETATAAARDEIRRVAQSHVAGGLSDVIRWLELAREASKAKRWPRSGELCELAGEKLADILGQPATQGVVREELRPLCVVLREIVAKLDKQGRPGTGVLQSAAKSRLDEAIQTLNRLNGTLRGIQLEDSNGPTN